MLKHTERVPQHAACNSGNVTLIFGRRGAGHTPPVGPVEVEFDPPLNRERSAKDQEHQSVEHNGEEGPQKQLRSDALSWITSGSIEVRRTGSRSSNVLKSG